MIEIIKYTEKHLNELKKMMLVENLDFNDVSLCLDTLYIVLEKKRVLGFAYYNLYNNKVYIDNLYIIKSERLCKLGDSLFRAILNALNLSFVENVYMRNSEIYKAFLHAEGIKYNENLNEFIIELPSFFQRKCKGSSISLPIN